MWVTLERSILRVRSRLVRCYSVSSETVQIDGNTSRVPYGCENIIDQSWNATSIRSEDKKSLRIAIVGMPNVGKSTLVNQLVGRPVCGASSKLHTTRMKSDAIYVEGDTQLVFIDTPGLVTNREVKKFHLDKNFTAGIDAAVRKADIVGVMQDVSHSFRAPIIDERVLAALKKLRAGTTSLLILNKVDKIKRKRQLLDIVNDLTGEKGWPHFSDVFMVSALKSDGIDDLRKYLIDSSKLRDWEYEVDTISDDPPAKLIERAVRAKFMEYLSQELPYNFQTMTEHVGELADGSMSTVVSIVCPNDRISKIMMGRGGERVKTVALLTEQDLCKVFKTTVRLKIAIKFSRDRDETVLKSKKK